MKRRTPFLLSVAALAALAITAGRSGLELLEASGLSGGTPSTLEDLSGGGHLPGPVGRSSGDTTSTGPSFDEALVEPIEVSTGRIAAALHAEAPAQATGQVDGEAPEIPLRAEASGVLEIHVSGHVPSDLKVVALATQDEDHHDFFTQDIVDAGAEMKLERGPYLLFLEVDGRAVTAFESVHLGRESVRVTFHLEPPVTVTGRVVDADGALPGVQVFIGPLTEDWSAMTKVLDRTTAARTGPNGQFTVGGLQPGVTLRLRVEDERFVRHTQEIEVASEVRDSRDGDGHPLAGIDVGTIRLEVGHRVDVQLEGWSDWGQATEFEITGRDIHGRKVSFDSRGRASFACDELGIDYLSLWYPGEPTVMANVQVEVKESMEPVLLRVGGTRDLTIGLSESAEIEETLGGTAEFFVSVNYRTPTGIWYVLNMEVDGFRDYHAFGVDSEEATVRLVHAENNVPFEWASRRVSFQGARSLRVDFDDVARPKTIRLAIDAETPLSGGVCFFRRRNDPTDWFSGEELDAGGARSVPSVITGKALVSYWRESQDILCMDMPIPTGPGGEMPDTLFIGPLVDVEFSVQDQGERVPEAALYICSREDASDYEWRQTGALGEPCRMRMASASVCEATADGRTLYRLERRIPVKPGINVIEVRRFGSLRLQPGVKLDEVRSLEFDRTLDDWRQEPWFKLEAPDGIAGPRVVLNVPHGDYEYTPAGGEPSPTSRVLVGATEELRR